MADKGLLKGFQKWVVFLFDGDYLPAICLQGQNETGCNSITVEEHGTGTTFSRTASFLYLDEAFIRRFQSIIHFPMPKQAERYRLWKNAFSEKTELDNRVDLEEIAEKYEMPGGAIMNVVRYATLMALKNNTHVINYDDLLNGIRKEFQKEGKTF